MMKKKAVTVLPITIDTEDGPVEELVNLDDLTLDQITELARADKSYIPYALSRYLEEPLDK
jgi:hypothetical protein